jgi:hypothetical protein
VFLELPFPAVSSITTSPNLEEHQAFYQRLAYENASQLLALDRTQFPRSDADPSAGIEPSADVPMITLESPSSSSSDFGNPQPDDAVDDM